MKPRLAYRDATIGYPGTAVVKRVTLDIAAGEVVGLIGPNGAGKSTILRAVTGAARVSAGEVELDGRPLSRYSVRERARVAAVVPQSVSAAFSFTAREFVLMGRHPHLSRLQQLSSADESLAHSVMEHTDTLRLADEAVDTLSGGDLQRLALAQALAQQPSVLLLDEATSHLDLNHRLQVLDLIRDLADSGMAVLAVFHDLDLAARYSDRLAVVDAGRLGPSGPPHDVLTGTLLARVFRVRAVVGTDPVTGSVTVTPVLREEAVEQSYRGRVLVVGGSGTGAPLMRGLFLAGYDVRAAALSVGDIDQAVAEALGVAYVKIAAFGTVDQAAARRIEEESRAADVVIVGEIPVGGANLGNLAAATAAPERTVFVGAFGPGRDFTDGKASALVADALARGARQVADVEAALAAAAEISRAAGSGA
ncbi:MAG: ABC transporter ATP-binding protein [Clostridiales bacterium]|nr:ABC transporter ATP-binding protein [Clostridiales bacterium]